MPFPTDQASKVWSAPLSVPERRTTLPEHPAVGDYQIEKNPQGGDSSSFQSQIDSFQSQIASLTVVNVYLQNQINGASISAVCNGDGTITVTLTWGS
jgi:hypothetical protein